MDVRSEWISASVLANMHWVLTVRILIILLMFKKFLNVNYLLLVNTLFLCAVFKLMLHVSVCFHSFFPDT